MDNKFLAVKDSHFKNGLIVTGVSAGVYAITCVAGIKDDDFFAIFLINYFIAVCYFFSLWFSGKFKRGRNGLLYLFPSLVLFLISAYSLNHLIPIFEHSAAWLTVALILVAIAYCAVGFFDTLPSWLRIVVSAVMGTGFVIFIYLSIYLVPLFPIGILASIVLGVSLHSFVPLLFVIYTIVWLCSQGVKYRGVLRSFLCGNIFAVAAALIFFLQWESIDRLVSSRYQHSLVDANTDLPSWIKVAQVMPHNHVAEAYLKSDLVYSVPSKTFESFGFDLPGKSFDETRKHDPLVMIASLLAPANRINEEERIKILQSCFDARHKTEERLWSGSDLETRNVISNIHIWPQFRMAYTEKTITVANTATGFWQGSQEGLYTFHLPEGGVVTSLSLWINGVEAKGILTTKGKADSAYKQIVGVEVRDPSVVHWQEGNRVTVRVFPVPENGNRIFKIGITAPLALVNDQLQYRNISFEGPWAGNADEIVRVKWEQMPENDLMDGFEEKGNLVFEKERSYQKDWQLQFKAPPFQANTFSFGGKSYSISSYKPFKTKAQINKIYLDLNSAWTEAEYEAVLDALQGKNVYVYDDGLIKIRENNKGKLFDRFNDRQFNIFPLQVIADPETSLLVTKSGRRSAEVSDLKNTAFATQLEAWLNRGEKLRLYNIGDDLNPYLKTLKEHRVFLYEYGNVRQLEQDIANNVFAGDSEDDNNVVVDHAGIKISRSLDTQTGTAPDHLMRLFAYNHLMQQSKKGIFTNLEADTVLVNEAQEAYVVTPLSSLVVLETAADYQRFNISDSNNSLHNASIKSTGAVPEPHEWALIIVTAVMLIWLTYKNKIKALWNRC